jgi:hypothetical protein
MRIDNFADAVAAACQYIREGIQILGQTNTVYGQYDLPGGNSRPYAEDDDDRGRASGSEVSPPNIPENSPR